MADGDVSGRMSAEQAARELGTSRRAVRNRPPRRSKTTRHALRSGR
jgi:hypothetical protein